MPECRKKLAILHSPDAPPGARYYMVMQIADYLEALGIDIIHLYGTGRFVPADAIFVHVDRSVVHPGIARFAGRYARQINGYALDIRKHTFVDGLLNSAEAYPAPVIVKSNLNYGGAPEHGDRNLLSLVARRARRALSGAPKPLIRTKADYRIFPDLADVPRAYFTRDNIVQKLILEKDGAKNLLREYIFLGDLHYENIERSAAKIITEDEHVSCLPFTPHPRLLNMRHRLKLDYGKIDYVLVDGTPFVFDANKTLGVGAFSGTEKFGDGTDLMLKAFAGEIVRMLGEQGDQPSGITRPKAAAPGPKARVPRFPHAARTIARA
ncbi:MAG: hypothetical protein FP825_04580 [Hyphomonas sp.]|uniref:hypothetical protein n=1 Tax=Hyphomonas sp. TaxID=87 RepID=UPI00185D6695|nr:hypothetical protein [Hyphomonas sp.]MBA3067744.1 hypothetical protein [Hyphomonas sp.]MBU3919963.1 hypothetical protein [Alphaproteobacteria bacterium]MBU4062168.1 hypothetical protein [Alphaproteobacteria bacterium]MBU4165603.1 hypothetical protein [Alphaproteobacteria bacterium]